MFNQLSAMIPLLDPETVFRILRECKKIEVAYLIGLKKSTRFTRRDGCFLKIQELKNSNKGINET
jgi:hypothetical protein